MSERQHAVAKEIGSRIKQLREEHGLSQEGLAREANMSFQTVNRAENAVRLANGKTLERLAKVFDVDLRYLLGMQDERGSFEPTPRGAGVSVPRLDRIALPA